MEPDEAECNEPTIFVLLLGLICFVILLYYFIARRANITPQDFGYF